MLHRGPHVSARRGRAACRANCPQGGGGLFVGLVERLGPLVVPFLTNFLVGRFGSPTKIDQTEKVGTLVLTSLEDLEGKPPANLFQSSRVWLRSEQRSTTTQGVLGLQPVWGTSPKGSGVLRARRLAKIYGSDPVFGNCDQVCPELLGKGRGLGRQFSAETLRRVP